MSEDIRTLPPGELPGFGAGQDCTLDPEPDPATDIFSVAQTIAESARFNGYADPDKYLYQMYLRSGDFVNARRHVAGHNLIMRIRSWLKPNEDAHQNRH